MIGTNTPWCQTYFVKERAVYLLCYKVVKNRPEKGINDVIPPSIQVELTE